MQNAAYLQPYPRVVVPFVSQTQVDQHYGHDGPLFVPVNCHYVIEDLRAIEGGRRKPALYKWLNNLDDIAVLSLMGTSRYLCAPESVQRCQRLWTICLFSA